MERSQWAVITIIFFLGMIFFFFMGNAAMKGEILSMQLSRQAQTTELGQGDIIFPLRSSLYFSFAFLCFLIFNTGWICGLLEEKAKRKERQ